MDKLLPIYFHSHNVLARKTLRVSNARFLAGIGLLGGFFYSVLGSTQRLAGLEENTREVIKYGALTPELLEQHNGRYNENYKALGRK